MKQLVMIALLGLLAGCSTLPRTVEVPVAIPCPAPPKVSRPRLAVGSLLPDSAPAEVVRAYAASMEALAGYAERLETILDGYRLRTEGETK